MVQMDIPHTLQVRSEIHQLMQDAQNPNVPVPVTAKENNVPPAGLRNQPFPDLIPPLPHDPSIPELPEQGGEIPEIRIALRRARRLPGNGGRSPSDPVGPAE